MLLEHFSQDLYEAFAPAQKTGNKNVIDYRDPEYKKHWDGKSPPAHIFLTNNDKAIIFNYGSGNTIEWPELMNILRDDIKASYQPGSLGLVPYRNGYLIDINRDNFSSWSGNINKYSSDTKEIAAQLLKLGLANESTPLWTGNWAGRRAYSYLSNVGKLMAANSLPRRITLYHGTSNYRWEIIKENGLNPIERTQRVWNKGSLKAEPSHRDNSVYLTASIHQAEYYATKAARVDVKRFGPQAQREAFRMWYHANSMKNSKQFGLVSSERQDEIEKIIFDTSRLAQWYKSNQKIVGVVLKISIPASQYGLFMADDDYLLGNSGADPANWVESLSDFGQVAFTGQISPNRIKLFKTI